LQLNIILFQLSWHDFMKFYFYVALSILLYHENRYTNLFVTSMF
jgi:hypothetical protein